MMLTTLAITLLLPIAAAETGHLLPVPQPPEALAVSENGRHVLATLSTVQQIAAGATCGDSIELSGEFQSYVKISEARPSCPVVIDASRTQIGNLTIVNSSNLIIRGGNFVSTKYASVNIVNSDHISVEDSAFDHSGTTAVAVINSKYVWALRNHVESSLGDGFDIVASQFVVISKNVCANNVVTPIHPDCVQAWDVKGKDLVSDIWITNNEAVGKTQGFDGFDHGDGGFDRVYVVANKISTTAVWAGHFNACRYCIMAYNKAVTLVGQPHGWGGARWFMTDSIDGKAPDSGRNGNIIKYNENGIGF